MDIPDGLPKWSGLNKTSDLVEDSPPEAIQELERERAQQQQEERANGGAKKDEKKKKK